MIIPYPVERGLSRRRFLALSLKNFAGLTVFGGAMAGFGAYHCVVNRREIFIDGLPPAFSGFRIALMSDFHHSPWIPASHIAKAVQLANSLKPDLVALTGDFVDCGRQWAPGCMAELSKLRARYGLVGVLGNHDHARAAGPTVRDAMVRAGITDLTNRGIVLHRDGAALHVAGTGDLWRDDQHLHIALSAARRPGSVILLQHNPDYAEHITDDRVGLMLSGHTHGGQCVFPVIGPPILPSKFGQKYASGLCRGPLAQVFVTTGVGGSFPPIRFRCPAEVALLTLRRGKRLSA